MSTNIEKSFGEREKYAELLSPKGADGEVNYDLLGKILTAKSLEEVLCASYVDPKHGVKLGVPGEPNTDWRYITEDDGVVILRKYNAATRINCFMGRGIVNAPVEKVQAYIADFTNRKAYDPMCSGVKVVKQLSDTDSIVYLEHFVQKFWGLFKQRRDSCFFSRQIWVTHAGSEQERKYVQTSMSVDYELCPERDECIRMELLPGSGWVLEPYRPSAAGPIDHSKTLVNYLAHVNCRGIRPALLVNKILQKQPLVVARLRKIFDGPPEAQHETVLTSTELPTAASHDNSVNQSTEDSAGAYCSNFPTAPMCRDAGLNLADSDVVDEPKHPHRAVPTTRNEVFFISASSSDVSQDHNTQTSYILSASVDHADHKPKPVQRQRSLLERIGSWFQAPKLDQSQSVPADEGRYMRKQPPTIPEPLIQSEAWSEVPVPAVTQEHVSEEDRTTGDEGFSSEVEAHGHALTPGQSPVHDTRSPDSDLMVSPQGESQVRKCTCGKGDLCDSWIRGHVAVEN